MLTSACPRRRARRARPRLLLHVGPHKTGSTAIQDHCSANRDWLACAGLWYPRSGTWFSQHAAIPGSLMASHPFLPASFLAQPTEPLVDDLLRELPRGQVALLSSEVFWELLMFLPDEASRLFRMLSERFRMTVLVVDRRPEARAWSSVKHAARAGLAIDAARWFSDDIRTGNAAWLRLRGMGCDVASLTYPDGDVVRAFLSRLPLLLEPADGAARCRRRIGRIVTERRERGGGSSRENAAPTHPRAAAFSLEFSRRLVGHLDGSAGACPSIARFMSDALVDPRNASSWDELPDERELVARIVSAEGRSGSLLTPSEQCAWEVAATQSWVAELAERNGCLHRLRQALSPGVASDSHADACHDVRAAAEPGSIGDLAGG